MKKEFVKLEIMINSRGQWYAVGGDIIEGFETEYVGSDYLHEWQSDQFKRFLVKHACDMAFLQKQLGALSNWACNAYCHLHDESFLTKERLIDDYDLM